MPATELEDLVEQIRDRLDAYLHATDDQAVDRFAALADLVTSDFTFRATLGALAVHIGGVLSDIRPAGVDGMFGVLPIAHDLLTPWQLLGNQLVVAAANQDHETVHAIISTILDTECGGDDAAAVFAGLAKHALSFHRMVCAGAHA